MGFKCAPYSYYLNEFEWFVSKQPRELKYMNMLKTQQVSLWKRF